MADLFRTVHPRSQELYDNGKMTATWRKSNEKSDLNALILQDVL